MSGTAPDHLWGTYSKKGTENTAPFHPIRHAHKAPLGTRYWCDEMHHEIRGSYQDLGKSPEGRYQNIEQLYQTTFLGGLVHETRAV